MFIRNAIIIIKYAKKSNDKNVAMFEKFNSNTFAAAFKSIVNNSFKILFSSILFFLI